MLQFIALGFIGGMGFGSLDGRPPIVGKGGVEVGIEGAEVRKPVFKLLVQGAGGLEEFGILDLKCSNVAHRYFNVDVKYYDPDYGYFKVKNTKVTP